MKSNDWTPWDRANGFRIGGIAGGFVGIGLALIVGTGVPWIVIACAAIGAVIGYRATA